MITARKRREILKIYSFKRATLPLNASVDNVVSKVLIVPRNC